MLRTRPVGERYIAGGKVAGIVVALAASGLLAACGGNDSTASSTPSLKTSTTTAVAQSKAPSAEPSAAESTPEQAPETSAAERPEPAPTSADHPPLSEKDQAYLDELKKRGVTPSSPDIALTAANYICQSKANGASDAEVKTFVNAMAGTDPGFDPQKMPVEQAGQIYVDVATETYCNK
ncbi:DUF732 domain-containing protein [Nocardia spumae]|uniref:DUF732 domain-containing protein n=1 Tax=Nocardia spumae TaxID=2887190 RepID=UPI001D13BA40|nr:DUF732 domain-containing protein [Nocardia spumae]